MPIEFNGLLRDLVLFGFQIFECLLHPEKHFLLPNVLIFVFLFEHLFLRLLKVFLRFFLLLLCALPLFLTQFRCSTGHVVRRFAQVFFRTVIRKVPQPTHEIPGSLFQCFLLFGQIAEFAFPFLV